MSYQDALLYLNSFFNYESIDQTVLNPSQKNNFFSIERIKNLTSFFDNPQDKLKIIHIAGSKGKGSTASMIAAILQKAGYRIGLYTSPHLISHCERIKINEKDISELELSNLVEEARPIIERFKEKSSLTYFEIFTILAFMYFEKNKVDFAVIETGLGGRLDATNIVAKPLVSVITPVSLDHTHILGDTISQITTEKAEIIKKNSICVSSMQERNAFAIIKEKCQKENTELFTVGRDLCFEVTETGLHNDKFRVYGMGCVFENLQTNLAGSHQVINSACAIASVLVLKKHGVHINPESIEKGLNEVKCPARIEIVRNNPLVVLDVSHNKISAEYLISTLKKTKKHQNIIFIIGICKDKNAHAILSTIVPEAKYAFFTQANTPRALSPEKLKEIALCIDPHKEYFTYNNVEEAYKKARKIAGINDTIVVTGSFYVAGDFLKASSLNSERPETIVGKK